MKLNKKHFLILIFLLGCIGCDCSNSKDYSYLNGLRNRELICESSQDKNTFQPIEALGGNTQMSINGLSSSNISGMYFLIIGGMSGSGNGSLNSTNAYTLTYAIKDQYGLKIKSEVAGNNELIRIKEVNSNLAGIRTILHRSWHSEYNEYYNEPNGFCMTTIVVRIFEVPKGTIKNNYSINLSN